MSNLKQIIMKKAAVIFLAAMIGGLTSVGFYKLISEDDISSNTKTTLQQDDIKLVTYTNVLPPEMRIDFTVAAKMSVNAVVHVKTEYLHENTYYSYDPFQDFFWGEGMKKHKKYTPAKGSGSGVIISTDGFIVTNRHVINGAEKIVVTLNNKKTYDAEIIGIDASTDLALLKIDESNLSYMPYGNSDEVKVGEWVLAVGNPFNLTSTVTAGIVSAKGRNINILRSDPSSGLSAIESFIQTDAAVNPGNSGGALVSSSGELIGINTAIKSNTGSYTGYSFAIPVNIVKKVVDDLLEYGIVQRGFIGVTIRNINSELAKEKDIDELAGVYVSGIAEGGAAEKAGIETGDVITKIGNADVTNVAELQEQISKFRPGNNILVTLKRSGKEQEFLITLKNKNGNTEIVKKENNKIATILGAHFRSISNAEKSKLRINNGLQVAKLNSGKLMSAGIKEGFIITRVDKKLIHNYDDLLNALEDKKGGVLIEGVYPNGMKAYYGFGI